MTARLRSAAFAFGGLAALVWGVAAAVRLRWICDDAFISIRYASNLVRGLGLVYNAGERVEGYTNFLFTLGLALGMRLGLDPERLAKGAGIVFFAALLALLVVRAWRARGPASAALPIAALLAAAHPDLAVWATSGLETSCFTFLCFAGFVAASVDRPGPGRSAAAGALFALASLTRPDGVLFAACAGGWILWAGRPRLRAVLAFAGTFALLFAPPTLWKLAYYGQLVSNTYWAKSANLAWWAQGLTYVWLYFRRYPLLLAAVPLAFAGLALRRRRAREGEIGSIPGTLVLATACAVLYTAYVAKVGGDFMFARFLIPVTPFFLVLFEEGIALALASLPAQAVAAGIVAASFAFSRCPVTGEWQRSSGIADERSYYRSVKKDWDGESRRQGAALASAFRGLPIGVGFIGGSARLMYYADPAVAVECETGLTDPVIARQPLPARGRIGHEKRAGVSYLVKRRRLLLCFDLKAARTLRLGEAIPIVPILVNGVPGLLLRWDPVLLAELSRRGAKVPDFFGQVDSYIGRMGALPDAEVRDAYRRLKLFYFDEVSDPARQGAFVKRLALLSVSPGR